MPSNVAAAFDAYREAAAHHASRPFTRESYAKVEAVREALCAALNYPRVTDHLGEYTNLHERDIPGHKRATRQADGLYRYSGYHTPVTAEQLALELARHEARSIELEKWFLTEPVERFIAGARVLYKGFDEKCYMAQFIRAKVVPFVRINEIIDLFKYPRRMEPVMGESEARAFFATLPEPFFTSHFQNS
jgi:hypothetical protein